MRGSRKGMRLNEAQHFGSFSRPLTKKMKNLRLFPRSSEENLAGNLENSLKLRHNPQALVRDQPSMEIAQVNYDDSKRNSNLHESIGIEDDRQDISLQMHATEFFEDFAPAVKTLMTEVPRKEILRSEKIEQGVYDNLEPVNLTNREESKETKEERDGKCKKEGTAKIVEDIKKIHGSESVKKEDKTWWRLLMHFLGIFWWKREDKRQMQNRTKKSEGKTLLTGNKGNFNIRQIYVASLGRDAKETRRRKSPSSKSETHEESPEDLDKMRIRQMSSPLC